jgi:hypothetical protein
LRAKIVDDKEDAEERIGNTVEAADAVRRDFGRNPKGLARLFAHLCVVFLANIAILASSHSLT